MRKCVEPDCDSEAGGEWSPYWCRECDRKRMERLDRQFNEIEALMQGGT